MDKIYIVGYMYSGKTTYGRQLAEERGLHFLDLDAAIEQHYHYSVSDLFARFGEATFRKLEQQVLHTTASLTDTVVATGGGTPCFADNMDFMLAHGQVIYLRKTVDQILARSISSHKPRPLMAGLSLDERRLKIQQQLAQREPYYLRATQVLTID